MIRIGLLGASRISRNAIVMPAAERDDVEVTCIAARDAKRAAEFAAAHGVSHVARDYAALIASEHVDLVYNALPPSGHAHWSIEALRAGKHVLCEKPFAMNAAQARAMTDAAESTGNILIEAFHYRFHPLFERVLHIVQSGEIGAPQSLEAHFNVPIKPRPGELRFDPALGGGAMMDLGCYPVHWVRTVMSAEPEVSSARAQVHATGVDVAMEAELVFPGGVRARVRSSMAQDLPAGADAALAIVGTRGMLSVVNPLHPHAGHSLAIETPQGSRSEEIAGKSTYCHQLAHVVAVLLGDAGQVTGGSDAVANMCVLDDIYRLSGVRPA